jgi:hypothetical protein
MDVIHTHVAGDIICLTINIIIIIIMDIGQRQLVVWMDGDIFGHSSAQLSNMSLFR